ncbi:POPLD-domain-containing protein, partial [Backusella circina FSU 941]
ARLYEINSMQNAIKSASYAINELAFQSLPRGLRRRAASHNLNRLPARLREKAAHEAASSGSTAALARKRVRKIKPPKNIVREFLRRQTSTKLSILHDASYWACFELKGQLKDIAIGMGYLYQYLSYPKKLISPISFLWKPETKDTLWLWVHPAGINEALEAIKIAIEKQDVKDTVQFRDLREDILRFDFTGPRSTALLQAILEPVNNVDAGNRLWNGLKDLRSSTSLPPGAVIGLTVNDPRLKYVFSFFKRYIWNNERRKNLLNKQSEHQLNLRRQEQLIPGTKLEPTENDTTIPILLFQRGQALQNTHHTTNTHELTHGWTLVLPRGWGLAFWKSFIFAGARVAGFDDIRAMHFENGYHCFPHDFPGTNSFENIRQLYKDAAQSIWDRKPPSKRVNYQKMGIEHPFEAAFESLCQVDAMIEDEGPTYSLIQGPTLSALLENTETYMTTIKDNAQRRGLELDYTLECSQLLAKVRVHYFGGGKPSSNALIYVLNDEADYQHHTQYVQCQSSPLKQSKRKLKEMHEIEQDKTKVSSLFL